MVARLGQAAHLAIDARRLEPWRHIWAQQQLIDLQPRIPGPAPAHVVPEGIERLVGVKKTDRIRPRLLQKVRMSPPAFRLQPGVVVWPRLLDLLFGRNDIVVFRPAPPARPISAIPSHAAAAG